MPVDKSREAEKRRSGGAYAVPGKEGQLWINFVEAGTKSGLWRSVDGGTNWHQIAGFTEVLAFGFGAPSATGNPAAVYVYGTLQGTRGLYYATDATAQAAGDLSHQTWRRISSAVHPVPLPTLHAIEGDRKVFGKVYIGTGGRGVVYTTYIAPKP